MPETEETKAIQPTAHPGKHIEADVRMLIFGTEQYNPTQLQTQTLLDYINDEEGKTPPQILRQNGRSADNWWLWPKRHPGFMEWWNGILETVFSDQLVRDLYKSLYNRGVNHDTAAAKIVIQRFDPRFTERNQQDNRHSFQGYEPRDAADSRERQRKALAEQVISALPVVEQDAREALPGPEQGITTDAHAPDENPHKGAIGVDGHVSPPFTPGIPAQSGIDDDEQPKPTGPNNDKTLDSEAITDIDPQGGDS